jgi:hypothetical protein
MHSGLLASLGFAGLLFIAPAALAADDGCCSDKAQVAQAAEKGCCGAKAEATPVAQAADKGCCGDKAKAAPVADKGCCGDKAQPAHAAHAADKTDKPQVAQASHAGCNMPCCKAADVSASAEFLTDPFFLTIDTALPVPPVVTGRGTPTIR